MDTNIYHKENRTRLKEAIQTAVAAYTPEFTYRDDPDFIDFCTAIRREVERQEIQREGKNGPEPDSVRMNKLYGVWYTSATFRMHWMKPTKRSENDMLWILYNRGWSFNQGCVAIIAWWRFHRRKVTGDMFDGMDALAERVWIEVQDKKMKKKMEAQQDSLRNRIIWFLQQGPSTTAYLAKNLNATSKAVDSHLYRLRTEGIVVRPSWGLYAIATTACPNSESRAMASLPDVERKLEVPAVIGPDPGKAAATRTWDLDEIEDDVAEPTGLPSVPYRDTVFDESYDLDLAGDELRTTRPPHIPTTEPRALPTAEPRW